MEFHFFEHKGNFVFFFNELCARARFFVVIFFPFCKGIFQKRAEKHLGAFKG